MQTPSAVAPELNLLFPFPEDRPSPVWRWSLFSSVGLHVILFFLGLHYESLIQSEPRELIVKKTVIPLYLPPDLLTQRAPNKQAVSKSFDLERLLVAQQAQTRKVSAGKGAAKKVPLPKQTAQAPVKQPVAQIAAEPPKQIASNQPPPQGLPDSVVSAPPAPAPVSNPTPSVGLPVQSQNAHHITPPKNSVGDILHQTPQANSDSTSTEISDQGLQSGPSSPAKQGVEGQVNSAIELKTDPQGTDFKPYLREILAIVRRNWFSVLPASARTGALRGTTTVQFIVNKDGSIPKLVISDASGSGPLDRAAVAGLSMSNPLPPLPPEFKGALIKLQFSFNYNVSQ